MTGAVIRTLVCGNNSTYLLTFAKTIINMKYVLTLLAVCLVVTKISAQKISVTTAAVELGNGYNSAFEVFIPHTTVRAVERKWVDFLKDNDAKVKTSKKGINGQNAIIKSICADTLQVFSKITENAEGISLSAAFSKNGTFIAPSTFADDSKMIEKILHSMALPLAKEGLEDKVKVAQKLLEAKISDQEGLEKTNNKLANENEKMKKQTQENEREIKDNEHKISDLKADVENKKTSLDAFKNKSKDLE